MKFSSPKCLNIIDELSTREKTKILQKRLKHQVLPVPVMKGHSFSSISGTNFQWPPCSYIQDIVSSFTVIFTVILRVDLLLYQTF